MITIGVTIQKVLEDSDLLRATSPDMRGLILHGRSIAEIKDLTPTAIQDLLDANDRGSQQFRVVWLDEEVTR